MYHVGIDVSKAKLDICLLADGLDGKRKTKSLPNGISSAEAVINWLVMQKRDPKQARIVMELAYGLHREGLSVSVVNPCRIREFAKGMGILTKTDKVDAYVLACYSSLKQPQEWQPRQKKLESSERYFSIGMSC